MVNVSLLHHRGGRRHFFRTDSAPVPKCLNSGPVSSEISDLCEISDLLLFLRYFTFQNKQIKFGNDFFDVCCLNQNILDRFQVQRTSSSHGNNFN